MRKQWFHYLIAGFCIIGAFATWSRWCWLPNGMNQAPKALGLHFIEGWLVFLLLGFSAGLMLIRIPENVIVNRVVVVLNTLALALCFEFVFKFGPKEACNALWISLFSAAIALIFSGILWLKLERAHLRKVSE